MILPFTTCVKGHDLTKPDAYIYLANKDRKCRECHTASLPKSRREKVAYGAFDGGMTR